MGSPIILLSNLS